MTAFDLAHQAKAFDPAPAMPGEIVARRTEPAHDLALQAVLDRLTGGVSERPDRPDGWVTAVRRLEARAAAYAPFPATVDQRLRDVLHARGIDQLYTHQAAAIDHALAGRHVVITTPTASGKTLCYNAPVLSTVLRDPSARALYLFPTKALAQDQLAELHVLADQLSRRNELELGAFTYDGDTPQDARRAIRGRAHIVLSNPDMIHSGILPHHPRWAKLFENLRYVVIDELHAYRGVFGSHLTNVLRRLRRICGHYGSSPTFICSSATIANPRELAEALVEEPFELVSESGAPRGEKVFLFVNPPVVNQQLGIRRSYLAETRRVASEFLKRSLQLIVFAQSRLSTEILTTYLKDDCGGPPGTRDQIRGYRGGYLPQRRREIEQGLRAGTVRAVVSTNALELGIDIGALDVCVMAGYPGSIAATWQRAGRAGRRSGRSAAVLVGSSAPLDQFVVRNPSYFFDASPERALINPDNLHILVDHAKCAAFELPFSAEEGFGRPRRSLPSVPGTQSPQPGAGVDIQQVLGILEEGGFVHRADGVWQWTNESYPADAVSLRSLSSDNFVIVDTTQGADVIGETSFNSGPATLHEKAIYLIEGALFQVEKLDFDGRKAYVRRIDCDYYTDAITYTKVTVLETFSSRQPPTPSFQDEPSAGDGGSPGWEVAVEALGTHAGSHGEVHVSSRVVGFKKIKFYTNENVGSGELDLPEQEMHTTAYWLTLPASLMAALPFAADDRRDGVVGLSFAMRQVAQLLLMCDRQDIGISIGAGGPRLGTGDSGLGAGGRGLAGEPGLAVHDSEPPTPNPQPPPPESPAASLRFPRRAAHLHLRQLSRRHRLQRAAVRDARRAVVANAGADRRLRLSARLSDLRRADRQHRSAGQDGGAADPGAAAVSTLADRLRGVIGAGIGERRTGIEGPNPQPPGPDPSPQPPPLGIAAVLGGEWREASGQRFLVVDRTYRPGHRHGQMAMADVMPPTGALWPQLHLLANAACAGRAVFIDLETTGLAGGAGTYAFLVGCGWFDNGSFRIRQFVLTSFAAERVLLDAVAEVAAQAGTVVTYNGKSFDLPLMETRFVLHRRDTPFAGMPHVDMLHPARRLWRNDEAGCRLALLEQSLCGHVRDGDVPGFEIPSRYFHYVRSGDARPLEAVLEHNRHDLLSLACVTARAAFLLDEGPGATRGAREALGLGRLYERGGLLRQARACFMRAGTLEDCDPAVQAEALRALAMTSRRLRCYEDAATAWRRILDLPSCPEAIVREATEALAVHHEHRVRDLPQARTLTLRSLTCQGTAARRDALHHRLARLDRKLGDDTAAVLF